MGGGSGGGGNGGRTGGGGGQSLLNDASFDQKSVTTAIKDGKLSQGDLQMHIIHTKYEIDQTRAQLDSMLANRGKTKAGDVRASKEFSALAAKRDAMKSNLGKMYDTMQATNKKQKGFNVY